MKVTLATAAVLAFAYSAAAQTAPALPASAQPNIIREIGFDQHPGAALPVDLEFRDEEGVLAPLSVYFGGKPVVLALVYYSCPMLCLQTLNNLAEAVAALPLRAGRDFNVVAVSFDPHDTPASAASKKAEVFRHAGNAAGWHFLTGEAQNIATLTSAVGFKYVWDDSLSQFAHPTGLTLATPDARIARYLFGIDYQPLDLRLAILDASGNRIGSVTNALLLYCYHYEPTRGRYGLAIMRVIRLGGAASVFGIGAFILMLLRRERRGVR